MRAAALTLRCSVCRERHGPSAPAAHKPFKTAKGLAIHLRRMHDLDADTAHYVAYTESHKVRS